MPPSSRPTTHSTDRLTVNHANKSDQDLGKPNVTPRAKTQP